jgi:hypothetical protein
MRLCELIFGGLKLILVLCLSSQFMARSVSAESISFNNDVMAVLSKAGCSAGACHGNANGKGGFKLSLRGEDPETDFLVLTRDQFGRRTQPLDPEQSLVLLKATAQIAHEGGQRFQTGSREYEILRQWIAAGTRSDPPGTPKLDRIEVSPKDKILLEPADRIQIRAWAIFSDGERRDISQIAVYEPNNQNVLVQPDGLVERQRFGEATVLVRYLHQQTPVRLAFVPERPDFQWAGPPENNVIDALVFDKLRNLRMNPSELSSDHEFLRRAYLDLHGLLPEAETARSFIADTDSQKRTQLIEQLLEQPEFADFWALKWSDLLRNEERSLDVKGVQAYHRWIRESLLENKPFDQFARELVSARGSTYQNPAANFYRANRNPVDRAESMAQLFLGTRLQCAQCHNHPFDRWTQDDYYDWTSIFSRVQYKVLQNRRRDNNDGHEFKGEQIVYAARKSDFKNARTGEIATPRFLGGAALELSRETDLLEQLADWMTRPENPFFARSQVNRIWYHLLGRGIVDPIDDFRPTNPASHPELLEVLTGEFTSSGFDLRHLIRLIMNSRTYQLSALPNQTNAEDELNFARAKIRRLEAEQLIDAQSQVTGAPVQFPGFPEGLRAAQLPGALPEKRRGQKPAQIEQFLQVFGKPPRLLTCECERSSETTMAQAFQMISGPLQNDMLTHAQNRLAQLLQSGKSNLEMVEELYWTALSRSPSPVELARGVEHLETAGDPRLALEDITWALLNSKEFLLRN